MTTAAYSLKFNDRLLHNSWPVIFLNDSDDFDKSALEARLRSGDYFETLATRLDQVAEYDRTAHVSNLKEELSDVIDELLYLQQRYFIVKKLDTPSKNS